jgi:hypothetical protein
MIVATSAFLILAAAYTGYWLSMAERIRAGVDPWAEVRRTQGYDVRWSAMAMGGFPAGFSLTFTDAALAGGRPLPFDVAAPTLVAEARPWNLRRWQVSAPRGVRAGVAGEGVTIAAATLDGAVTLGRDAETVIDLAAHDVTGSGAAAQLHIGDAETRVVLAERPPETHRDTAYSATLRVANIALPRDVPALGATVEAVTLTGSFKGTLPPGRLRQALAAWRDDGGTIELEEGSLQWGALAARANGTLALDAALQPIGALTATVENQNAIIDAAVAGGTLREDDGDLAKMFLGLMAKPGPNGTKQLTLPLRVQNDRIFLGPAQIAALPWFTWE